MNILTIRSLPYPIQEHDIAPNRNKFHFDGQIISLRFLNTNTGFSYIYDWNFVREYNIHYLLAELLKRKLP